MTILGIVAAQTAGQESALEGFQPIVMNFRTGEYTVAGVPVDITSLLGGAQFDPDSISASGMLVGFSQPTNYPEAVGYLLDSMQQGLITGMNVICQWSKVSGGNNSGIIFRAFQVDTDSDYIGVETFQSSPAIFVEDGYDININHAVAWNVGDTARQRIAVMLAGDTGSSGFLYAASGNGSTPAAEDYTATEQYLAATIRLFGVAEDFLSVNDWHVEYLEIAAVGDPAELPTDSTPVP